MRQKEICTTVKFRGKMLHITDLVESGNVGELKYGSEEKGSLLCRCSSLLGFIMSKNLRGL